MNAAFKGFDRSGAAVSGTVEAGSLAEAREALAAKGVFVTEVVQATAAELAAVAPRGRGAGSKGRRLREVSAFSRQLAVLVSTGTPVVEAIGSLERQAPHGEWRRVLESLRSRLEDGMAFSAAMSEHPRYFDAVARSLVAAGEQSGKMDAMLARVASLSRQEIKVRSSILGAMVYPVVLLSIATVVLGVMIGFVLPRFKGLFESLSAPLPPTTKLLMGISEIAREQWYIVVPACIAAVVGAVLYLKSPAGVLAVQHAMLRVPKVRTVAMSFITARIVRILGVLLEGKVPLLDAVRLASASAGHVRYERLLNGAHDAIMRGENFSSALSHGGLVAQSVIEAVRSGERTGQMASVLLSIADYMDEDNDIVLRSLSSIVEPLILLVLGVVIGFVAMSMFLPLFDLTSMTQGGPGGGGP